MIDRLVDASAHHRFIVLIVVAALAVLGWQSLARLPLDALPELGAKQVIVSSRWERSPELIDAQVTYPIVSTLQSVPRVQSVRGISDAGTSLVYAIFDDDVDLYWARARTLEYLSAVASRLPEGVTFELGPDATSVGWVLQYVLVDRSGSRSLADLRAYQDWYLRFQLRAVRGVAEVSTVGGFVRQYQVGVDPNRLVARGTSMERVAAALRSGNRESTGGIIESGGGESIVRGLGSVTSAADLNEILVTSEADGTPVRIKDVAQVTVGAEVRRGLADLDGAGEVVSGIVVMRQGENALDIVDRVKARIRELEPSLPSGLAIEIVYDRSSLIRRAIETFRSTILEVMATVALVILIFLAHAPSAAIPIITLSVSVLMAFLGLRLTGIGANIMSLGGIAIAIGALVDASIIVVEQTHKKLEEWNQANRPGPPEAVILRAIKEVARPSFFALLIIAVSFLPVLAFKAEAGRLFAPLAYAKSMAMLIGAVLAITLDPALRLLLTRVHGLSFKPKRLCDAVNAFVVGRLRSEESHSLTKYLIKWYEPFVRWSLRHQREVFVSIAVIVAVTLPLCWRLGSELMPQMPEGVLLYMPATMPGIAVSEAQRLVQNTDRILKAFPEVEHVLGKAGHADSATDPAPLSMLETLIVLRPTSDWRRVPTWYSPWAPEWAKRVLRRVTPDHIAEAELIEQMNRALNIPGLANAWSMPIRGRIDMLTTGIRTPLGLKVTGTRLEDIERISAQIASSVRSMAATRNAFAEPVGQGSFLDFKWKRAALARAGVTVEEAQAALQYAVAGENVTSLVHGRERYSVNVRYASEFSATSPTSIDRALVFGETMRRVPIGDVADVVRTAGPTMVRNDDGLRTGYVYVDIQGSDYDGFIAEASRRIRASVSLPEGVSYSWSGRYEELLRAKSGLLSAVPLTLLIVVVLLHASTRSLSRTMIVLLAVPFSAVGAIWAIYLFGYQMSLAVWVGLIALLGIDAETGVFMLLYLDQAFDRMTAEGRMNGRDDLELAVVQGAARRLRPKFMTVLTMLVGMLPIMWSTGTGSDLMKRVAAPMIGGVLTSFALELLVYPVIYFRWRGRDLTAGKAAAALQLP